MFDPVHLRTFVTVARTLSFTRAAAELGLQQSTVSHHVRKLEAVAGRKLFTRDTHSVELTADGRILIGFAHSILEADSRAMAHFTHPRVCGVLRFGLAEELAGTQVPAAIREFTLRHPGVRVELSVRADRVLERMLADGAVDLTLAERRPGDDGSRLAWRDRLVWIGRADAAVDRDSPLPLVLPSYPSTATARALEALRDRGRAWYTAATSSNAAGLWAAVQAGLGVAVHPAGLVPPGLAELTGAARLPDLGEVDFALAQAPREAAGPAGPFCEALLLRLSRVCGGTASIAGSTVPAGPAAHPAHSAHSAR